MSGLRAAIRRVRMNPPRPGALVKSIKNILVPIDFSPHSEQALQVAADLARRYGASLELAHVYHPLSYALPEGYVLIAPEQLREILAQFELQLKAARADVLETGVQDVQTVLLEGDPCARILHRVKERGHDLIVMATHGRSGFKRMFIGSVAENVVRAASCPVLTIRTAA
jgi:universal stress protein A